MDFIKEGRRFFCWDNKDFRTFSVTVHGASPTENRREVYTFNK